MRHLFAACLFALAAPAFAQTPAQSPWCRNGAFATDPVISVARVRGEGRAFLRSDDAKKGCPAADECRAGYVLPGQELLISRSMNGFTCSLYQPSGAAGWIANDRLEEVITKVIVPADWAGHWVSNKDEDSSIDITRDGARLKASGVSYWPGRLYMQTPGNPSQHSGAFELSGEPKGDVLNLSAGPESYDCKLQLRRIGDYLVVADAGGCGGMNVSFSNVYVRSKIG